MTNESENVFQQAARDQREQSLVGEFWAFLSANKKWWLLPLLAVMLAVRPVDAAVHHGRRAVLSIPCSERRQWVLTNKTGNAQGGTPCKGVVGPKGHALSGATPGSYCRPCSSRPDWGG